VSQRFYLERHSNFIINSMKDNNAKKHTRYSGCLLGQRIMEPRSRWDRSRSTVRERVGNDIVEYNTRGLSEDEVSRLEQVCSGRGRDVITGIPLTVSL